MARALVAVPSYPRLPRGRVHGWADDGVGVPARYIDALHRADAQEALFLPTAWTAADAAALLARVDGLLLIGGGDLDPATYGQTAETTIYGVDAARMSSSSQASRASRTAPDSTTSRSSPARVSPPRTERPPSPSRRTTTRR